MSTATIVFPNVPYKVGFTYSRRWNTSVSPENPFSGRVQRVKNWSTPKRQMNLTVLGLGGSGATISPVTVATVRDFLYTVAGRYRNFFIFSPHMENYSSAGAPQQTFCGLFNTTFPMTCPFKGGTITNIYKNGVLYKATGSFTQDANGTFGETRIAGVTGGLPALNDSISVDVIGAYERIQVVSLTDIDDFQFDFSAADPPTEINLKLEEDFG